MRVSADFSGRNCNEETMFEMNNINIHISYHMQKLLVIFKVFFEDCFTCYLYLTATGFFKCVYLAALSSKGLNNMQLRHQCSQIVIHFCQGFILGLM